MNFVANSYHVTPLSVDLEYIPKQAEELVFTFAEHAIFDPEKTAPIGNSGPVFSGSKIACSASAKSQFFNLFGYRTENSSFALMSKGSLEDELKDSLCRDVDVQADCGFDDFLEPNEMHPEGVRPFLADMSPGLIVSVGTERCFFDLVLSDPEKCEGMVVRDINPRVKAYVDFNVLLLQLSDTRKEYCSLAEKPENNEVLQQKLLSIREKILQKQNIPSFLKGYYQKHLEPFARVYYGASHSWVHGNLQAPSFTEVNYHHQEELFAKVQKYAILGRIVSTIGKISDLSFLRCQKVSAVDTSNIHNYTTLDVDGDHFAQPLRIIWTLVFLQRSTNYHSFFYTHLTKEEKEEIDRLQSQLQEAVDLQKSAQDWCSWLNNRVLFEETSDSPGSSYTKASLRVLKQICAKYLYVIPGFGPVLMDPYSHAISRLRDVPLPALEWAIKDPAFVRFVPLLVDSYAELKEKYFVFMCLPGWKDAFESAMNDGKIVLKDFVKDLKKNGMLQLFVDRFGRERLSHWDPKDRAMITLFEDLKLT